MSAANGVQRAQFTGPAKTAKYRPRVVGRGGHWLDPDHRGFFSIMDVERMRHDPQVAFGLSILRAPLSTVKHEAEDEDPDVAEFVDATWRRIWANHLDDMFVCTIYENMAAEIMYRESAHEEGENGDSAIATDSLIEFDRLKCLYPLDCSPLERGGKLAGIAIKSGESVHDKSVEPGQWKPNWIAPPRSLWIANEPEFGSLWGKSCLRAAWYPWREKSARHGALDVRRLWYVKNCFDGDVMRHPPDEINEDGVRTTGNADYARQILENKETGGVLTLPNTKTGAEGEGEYEWTYEPAKPKGELPGLHEYIDQLDTETLRALKIPPEVVSAAESGSGWAGRTVPFLVFLTREDGIAAQLLAAIKAQIIDWLVLVNFGERAKNRYKLTLKSLVPDSVEEQAKDQQGASGAAGMGGLGQVQGGGATKGASQWVPFRGKRGGKGMKNRATGAVVYGNTERLALVWQRSEWPVERLSLDDPWQRYTGPHGGKGWKHGASGEVVYQEEKPGGHGASGQAPEGGGKLARIARAGVNAFKAVGHAAAHLEHVAKEFLTKGIDKNIDRLSAVAPAVAAEVRGLWYLTKLGTKAAFSTYIAGQNLAARVVQEAGASDKSAKTLSWVTTGLDVLGAKAIPLTLIGLGMPEAGIAGSFIPLGSAAYLAYSTARQPLALLKAAVKSVKSALSRKPATPAETLSLDGSPEDALRDLLERIQDREADGTLEEWMACLFAALDETDSLAEAVELAEEAFGEMGDGGSDEALSLDGAPEWLGWVNKGAHAKGFRWYNTESKQYRYQKSEPGTGRGGKAKEQPTVEGAAKQIESKPAPKPKAEKPSVSVNDLHAKITGGKLTYADLPGLIDEINALPQSAVNDLKKRLAVKVGGKKVEQAKRLAKEALAGDGSSAPGSKAGNQKGKSRSGGSEVEQAEAKYKTALGRWKRARSLADKSRLGKEAQQAQQEAIDARSREDEARRSAARKPIPSRSEEEWRKEPAIAAYGRKLSIADANHPDVQAHLNHLNKVPVAVARFMAERLGEVVVGTGALPNLDDMGHLKGVRPRGWPEGKTWDDAPGAYNTATKKVIAGTGSHGCSSLVLHEYGHGVGFITGLQDRTDFIDLHRQVFGKLTPYHQQDGPGGEAGREELFAEAFAATLMSREQAVRRFGDEVVKWMEDNVINKMPE